MADGTSTVVADDEPPLPPSVPPQAGSGSPENTLRQVRRPELKPLDARLRRERARNILVGTFAVSLLFTLGASFAGALMKWTPVKDWLQLVLPAETALFGSALGFYFGKETDPR
jgi:hypothetical protein